MTNTHQPGSHQPTADEKGLSVNLISVASALIVVAVFAGSSYVDKVTPGALVVGFFLGALSVLAFALSIFFGGKGVTAPSISKGVHNPFNRQVLSGLAGLALLLAAAAVFTLNRQAPPSDMPVEELRAAKSDIEELTRRADAGDAELRTLRLQFEQHHHTRCGQRPTIP